VKLYQGVRSSASWRVRWALALKRVAHESVFVDVAAGEHHRVVAPLNPLHAVPTLVLDDGRVLTESVAIFEWLEETIPEPPLLPGDPFARARARELVSLVNSAIHPLQNTAVRVAVAADEAGRNAWAARWIERGLGVCEAHLRDGRGRFCAGDRVGMADLFLAPQVRNAERFGADLSGFPRVRAIYAACMATPEARATDPDVVRVHSAGGV
jgi:maleylacetoacetate isomerase